MRVARRSHGSWAVVAAAVLVGSSIGSRVEAACNTIPSGAPGLQYYGFVGTVNRPFASPKEALQILRRPCDVGDPLPTSTPAPRTLLAVDSKAPGAKAEILIIEPAAAGCDATVKQKCEQDLAAAGLSATVRCKALPSTDYAVDPTTGALRLVVPDDQQPGFALASGALAIAVTARTLSPPCATLLKSDCKSLTSASASGFHACIDRLYAADPACSHAELDATFASVTLLPAANEYHALCFTDTKYCTENAPKLRYAIDGQGNVVVPVDWQSLLDTCKKDGFARCGFDVDGDFVPPKGIAFAAPGNDPQNAGKNEFLESFTADGRTNSPYFVTRGTIPGGAGFKGKADEPFSVLRIRQQRGRCVDPNDQPTGKRCSNAKFCGTGERCQPVCVEGASPGKPCTADGQCGNGRCGRSHALEKAHQNGRWWLDRDDGAFCRLDPVPSHPCASPNACTTACVRYQARAGNPFALPTPTPPAVPTPEVEQWEATEELERALLALVAGATELLQFAASYDGSWVAAFVEKAGGTPGAEPGAARRETVLVVARSDCGGGQPVCSPVQLPVDRRPLGLAFHGDQLRFLLEAPASGAAPGEGGAEPALADLELLVPAKLAGVARPVAMRVSRVVVGDQRYDPLAEQPNGAALFLTPAGRCFEGETLLSAPAYCRPGEADDCPAPARCRRALIAVAVDLHADLDGDGVPDVLARQ